MVDEFTSFGMKVSARSAVLMSAGKAASRTAVTQFSFMWLTPWWRNGTAPAHEAPLLCVRVWVPRVLVVGLPGARPGMVFAADWAIAEVAEAATAEILWQSLAPLSDSL